MDTVLAMARHPDRKLFKKEQESRAKSCLNKTCACCTCRCCSQWMLLLWFCWNIFMAWFFLNICLYNMHKFPIYPSGAGGHHPISNVVGEECSFHMYIITSDIDTGHYHIGYYMLKGSCNNLYASAAIFTVSGISYDIYIMNDISKISSV